VAVKDRARHAYAPQRLEHVYKLLFQCRDETASRIARVPENSGTSAADFFPVGALPPLSLGRTLPSDVVLLVAHRDAPELPTYFD
jgi:hypothetical protein